MTIHHLLAEVRSAAGPRRSVSVHLSNRSLEPDEHAKHFRAVQQNVTLGFTRLQRESMATQHFPIRTSKKKTITFPQQSLGRMFSVMLELCVCVCIPYPRLSRSLSVIIIRVNCKPIHQMKNTIFPFLTLYRPLAICLRCDIP